MKTWLIAGAAAVISGLGGMAIAGFAASGNGAHGGPRTNAPCVQGAGDVGETYYPGVGNTGYDVAHYDLDLKYDPATRFLDGEATITASATERLCRFNLDLRKLDVKSVIVDGHRADFTRDG